MRDRLIAIYNALLTIETKGLSTLTMADIIRELQAILREVKTDENGRHQPGGI